MLLKRASALAIVLFACSVERAFAQDASKQQCLSSFESAQDLRAKGRLRQAREQLLVCAREPCAPALRNDCSPWLAEVQRAIPSVVIGVRDAQGHDIVDVVVRIDGEVVTHRLDGRPIEIDPGVHTLRMEAAARAPIEQTLLVREGEKNRDLLFTLEERAALPPRRERTLPVSSLVLGGVSLAAFGAGTYFGLTGLSRWNQCHDGACTASDESFVDARWIATDIALGVGLIAGAIATYLFVQ
jgi:hypothetical protein